MNEPLWERVERALDEGRRPGEDPALARALAEDSEAAQQVALLERRLALLGELEACARPCDPAERPRHARRLALALALAAAALLALLGRWAAHSLHEPAGEAREQRIAWRTRTVQTPEPRFRQLPARSGPVLRWTLSGDDR